MYDPTQKLIQWRENTNRQWKGTKRKRMENLTMCNSSEDSEQTKPSDKELSALYSVSVARGDGVGIKSCTSAKTGGGEGCLMMLAWRGVSIVSKEIKEPGSSALCIRLSSFGGRIDSTLDLLSSELLQSFFVKTSSSIDCHRLCSL